jgi:hypothetical integral membrane protein (TIGR02206 family)
MLEPYFTPWPETQAMALFSSTHIIALLLVVLSCIALMLCIPRLNSCAREWLRHALAWFSLLNFAAWYVWEYWVGWTSWAYSLPLQLCTLSLILGPIMLWTRSYRLFEICYFWAFAGATQALLTPDIGIFTFPHFVAMQFFCSHACNLWCVIYMQTADGYRPYWGSLGRTIAWTLLLMVVSMIVNSLTGGNYMYVGAKPVGPSLLDFLGPWPWYIVWLIVLGIAMMSLVYLPYAIGDWRRRAIR